MLGEYLHSTTGKVVHRDHTEYYTTHIVISPKKKIDILPKDDKRAVRKMKKSGVETGDNIRIVNKPYIIYQSRCEGFIRRSEYAGRIKLGNNVVLFSSPTNCFPNQFIRLCIVKIAQEKIGRIIIGSNVYVPGISIVSYEKVEIHDNVMLGPGVIIMDCNGHDLYQRGQKGELERLEIAPVIIEENAWIGYGVVILKGVRIGKNSVVGINSVVHESVPDNVLVAGNPAKIVKQLK